MMALLRTVVVLVVVAHVVFCAAVDLPEWKVNQVHIALAGSSEDGHSNKMTIMWNTPGKTSESVVKYGLAPGQYTEEVSGSSSSYWESFNHRATLGELKPDTKYYYICGSKDAGDESFSAEKSFTSAPITTDLQEKEWQFITYGDLGSVNGEPTTEYIGETVASDDVKLVWHSGDVGYADDSFLHFGCYTRFCYENRFDEYMNKVQDQWASIMPYMTMPGNHEADCHSPNCMLDKTKREKLSNFTAYNHRFTMPSEESNGTMSMWYSFNYGNVHFVSIDTETGYPGAASEKRYVMPCGGFGDMMTWLENDLATAAAASNRAERPWIFVSGHRPVYESTGDSINENLSAAVEDLFLKYGVDVYFAGHRHYYARYFPLFKGAIDPAGYTNPRYTTYLTTGGPGNDEMDNIQRKRRELRDAARDVSAGVVKPSDPAPKEVSRAALMEKAREAALHLSAESIAKLSGMLHSGSEEESAIHAVILDEERHNKRTGVSDSERSSGVAQWDMDNHVGIARVYIQGAHKMRIDYIRTTTGEVYDTVTLERDAASRGM